MVPDMYENVIHAYEKLPLGATGMVVGCVLLLLHLVALAKPAASRKCLTELAVSDTAAQVLLALDFAWVFLLLYDTAWNPLRMNLFDFEAARGVLLIVCPGVWLVLTTMVKENLFGRALGLFLLLLVMVPLSAAFLKDPATRLLIPVWCYPVLTIAMFWVAKPYLFRDWMNALAARPRLFIILNAAGAVYAFAILLCAILFW